MSNTTQSSIAINTFTVTGTVKFECIACDQTIWINCTSTQDALNTLAAEGWGADNASALEAPSFFEQTRYFAACPKH